MDTKVDIGQLVIECMKSIWAFALARTDCRQDADDLAQEIIVELLSSAHRLENSDAVYGWLWAVARNTHKRYLRSRSRIQVSAHDDHTMVSSVDDVDAQLLRSEELGELRRELALLTGRHRQSMTMYYIDGLGCHDIAQRLGTTPEMVKYLLFRARKTIREGMAMSRELGELSYHPRNLALLYWGQGENIYCDLCRRKLSQNILHACYYDALSMEQLSGELGVPCAYLEDDVATLEAHRLLESRGGKLRTSIVVFSKALEEEVDRRTLEGYAGVAETVHRMLVEREANIRAIGFTGREIAQTGLLWHISAILMREAFVNRLQTDVLGALPGEVPPLSNGGSGYVWGSEEPATRWRGGICNIARRAGKMVFMDFQELGGVHHSFFYTRPERVDVVLKVACGYPASDMTDSEKDDLAELIANGFVRRQGSELAPTVPIYTPSQYGALLDIIGPTVTAVSDQARAMLLIVEGALRNHSPAHLEGQVTALAGLKLMGDAIAYTVGSMVDNGYLPIPSRSIGSVTTHAILSE